MAAGVSAKEAQVSVAKGEAASSVAVLSVAALGAVAGDVADKGSAAAVVAGSDATMSLTLGALATASRLRFLEGIDTAAVTVRNDRLACTAKEEMCEMIQLHQNHGSMVPAAECATQHTVDLEDIVVI